MCVGPLPQVVHLLHAKCYTRAPCQGGALKTSKPVSNSGRVLGGGPFRSLPKPSEALLRVATTPRIPRRGVRRSPAKNIMEVLPGFEFEGGLFKGFRGSFVQVLVFGHEIWQVVLVYCVPVIFFRGGGGGGSVSGRSA